MSLAIVWFRQDLRLNDNPAWHKACAEHTQVLPLYIHDTQTHALGGAQRWWLHHSLLALHDSLDKLNLPLCLQHGTPLTLLQKIIKEQGVDAIYWNRCYEPASISRDTHIKSILNQEGIKIHSHNGSLFNEPWTIQNKSGSYFKVFTPYWKHCLQHMAIPDVKITSLRPTCPPIPGETLNHWQLLPTRPNWAKAFHEEWEPGEAGALKKLDRFIEQHLNDYQINRNIPALDASSKLSPHLHWGEISPWTIWRAIEKAKQNPSCNTASADHFLSEMGWREFSYHLLYHFPTLPQCNFKNSFDSFPWQNNKSALKQWQTGNTGYPIVDAGMRELWHTGYMHNRVRMIVASFLTKDLLIDWREGAAWFWDTLVDADLANNSASWQWVAGCGADAAPYFRIFNPVLQSAKFDPSGEYIRQWVPELRDIPTRWIHEPWEAPQHELPQNLDERYPKPMVNHLEAKKIALANYGVISKGII